MTNPIATQHKSVPVPGYAVGGGSCTARSATWAQANRRRYPDMTAPCRNLVGRVRLFKSTLSVDRSDQRVSGDCQAQPR